MADTKAEVTDAQIATRAGLMAVKALTTTTPGLVVTRANFELHSKWAQLGLWAVTHARSGRAFAQALPNSEIAMLTAEWLGRLGIDWTQEMDAIVADKAAQEAYARFAGQSDRLLKVTAELLTELDFDVPRRRRCAGAVR